MNCHYCGRSRFDTFSHPRSNGSQRASAAVLPLPFLYFFCADKTPRSAKAHLASVNQALPGFFHPSACSCVYAQHPLRRVVLLGLWSGEPPRDPAARSSLYYCYLVADPFLSLLPLRPVLFVLFSRRYDLPCPLRIFLVFFPPADTVVLHSHGSSLLSPLAALKHLWFQALFLSDRVFLTSVETD